MDNTNHKKNIQFCATFVTDINYVYYTYVSIASIKKIDKKLPVVVFVDSESTYEEITNLLKFSKYRCEVIVYEDFECLYSLQNPKIQNHVTIMAYVKCEIPRMLPNYDYIIIIDTDILIGTFGLSGIKLNFSEPIAAVPDALETQMEVNCEVQDSYFNSGFMVVNNNIWHERKFHEQVSQYLKNGSGTKYLDQDLLNNLIKGEFFKLSKSYNAISETLNMDDGQFIHFAGTPKPWDKNCQRVGTIRWQENSKSVILELQHTLKSLHYKLLITSTENWKKLIKIFITRILPPSYILSLEGKKKSVQNCLTILNKTF